MVIEEIKDFATLLGVGGMGFAVGVLITTVLAFLVVGLCNIKKTFGDMQERLKRLDVNNAKEIKAEKEHCIDDLIDNV